MDNIDISNYSIGVIVARFQIHDLHDGHHYVIKQVTQNHKKTIIFLGVPRFIGTKKNPLDFDTRKKMIQSDYPDSIILAIQDQSDNNRWTSELDKRIREVYPHGEVLMYGSRDSFIPHYKNGNGKFDTKELEPLGTFAGTDVRRLISEEVKNSKDFRSGVIYQSYNSFPKVIPTVDIVPIDEKDRVLLCRKYDESKWRFIGGFIKNSDLSAELAAKRIFKNKVGINSEGDDYRYIGSYQIPDWRFRGEEDKIMTTFFTCRHLWGSINPTGDIAELKFFNLSELSSEMFMSEHSILFDSFIEKFKKI